MYIYLGQAVGSPTLLSSMSLGGISLRHSNVRKR